MSEIAEKILSADRDFIVWSVAIIQWFWSGGSLGFFIFSKVFFPQIVSL